METLGLAVDAGGQVMGRRAAPLFLAVAGLALWFAHQPKTPTRGVFVLAWSGALILVAAIGAWDFMSGRAGQAIALAIAVELVIAVSLILCHWRS